MNAIHHVEMGNGRPLIFLHGFCETSAIWMKLATPLAKKYKIILPDLPGFGASPLVAGNFSLHDVAIAMNEWIHPWENSRPVLVGHSLGGYVALAMAQFRPPIFAGLGLFHSTALADTDEKKENRNRAIAFVTDHGVEAYTRTFVPGLFFDKNHPDIPEIRAMAAATGAKTLLAYLAAMRDRPSTEGFMEAYDRPTLLIGGERDLLIPPLQLQEQAQKNRSSVIHMLADTAHMGMLESKVEAQKAIEDFMNFTAEIVT